jgi:hypothetical protein
MLWRGRIHEPFSGGLTMIYHRTPQTWTYDAYGPGDVIEIMSFGVRIPVVALYRSAGVPEALDDFEGEV